MLAPVTMNAFSFGMGASKLRAIHRGLASACDPLLETVPVDADLRSFDPSLKGLRDLLAAAVAVPGVLLPVATKVLFRKRRDLIPMLDNVVIEYYLRTMGALELLAKTQDKRRAPDVGIGVLKAFREDLIACYQQLSDVSHTVAAAGYPTSPLRLLELLVWTEVEPQAYYRT